MQTLEFFPEIWPVCCYTLMVSEVINLCLLSAFGSEELCDRTGHWPSLPELS